MRLLLHDYPGHTFQVQLSRALATRGHEVLHVYSESVISPRGDLVKKPTDSPTFNIAGLSIGETVSRGSLFKRRGQEIRHGQLVCEQIRSFKPDVVLAANTPLDALTLIRKESRDAGARFSFWVQDLIGEAINRLVSSKIPVVGPLVGQRYIRLEERILRSSDDIILIANDFRKALPVECRNAANVHVIENWAPLDELPVRPRDNEWSKANGLSDSLVFLYSGTLGMKHNPGLLLELAKRFRSDPKFRLVVISEGPGIEWLKERKAAEKLENMVLLPFQPFKDLPDVMATADVLIAILEPDAGEFSVPSKVLSYLCAQRPILLAVPLENLSAKIVKENRAGLASSPEDSASFVSAAEQLVNDPALRKELAYNGRNYAERTFNIDSVCRNFESILCGSIT